MYPLHAGRGFNPLIFARGIPGKEGTGRAAGYEQGSAALRRPFSRKPDERGVRELPAGMSDRVALP